MTKQKHQANNNTSLVEAAKSFPGLRKASLTYSLEEEELYMAWLNDEIKLMQVQHALKANSNGQQVYVFLARCARQLFLKAQQK